MRDRMTAREFRAEIEKRGRDAATGPDGKPAVKPWSSAVATTCQQGHKHASKMEARVCTRITLDLEEGERLFQQVRMPIFSLAPDEKDRASFITVDFIITRGNWMHRAVDAKAKGRVSREWRRGSLAFKSTYGIPIEEADK